MPSTLILTLENTGHFPKQILDENTANVPKKILVLSYLLIGYRKSMGRFVSYHQLNVASFIILALIQRRHYAL